MVNDPFRRTGRTTKQLREAEAKGALFIVHTEAMRDYCRHINPGVKIVVLTDRIEDRLIGTTDPIVDHAVWQCAETRLLQKLDRALRLVCRSYPNEASGKAARIQN